MSKRNFSWSVVIVALGALMLWQVYGSGFGHRSVRPLMHQNSQPFVSSSTERIVASVTGTNALVVRVVDGDTIKAMLDGERDEITVRLLGINTPESVDPRRPVECFGKEASAYTKMLLEGHRIRLDPDFEADNIDKYGRFLRNIILEDGTDFDAKLVQEGYAYAYLSFPLNRQRKTQLRHLQEEAQAAARGLWNPKTCNGQK